jgi:hypothetical protein
MRFISVIFIKWGHAVPYLAEALSYKPEGRGFRVPMRWISFLNLPNPSIRNMVLWSTQPLTEMSTRKLPGVGDKGRPGRKADNLAAICEPID